MGIERTLWGRGEDDYAFLSSHGKIEDFLVLKKAVYDVMEFTAQWRESLQHRPCGSAVSLWEHEKQVRAATM